MSKRGILHEISVKGDGVTWRCSCGLHGVAMSQRLTGPWASEHVLPPDTKTIKRG